MQNLIDNRLINISLINSLIDKAEDLNKVKLKVDYASAIHAYIEVKSRGWSINTQRAEVARLRSLLPLLDKHGLDPESVYNDLVQMGRAAYSIKTAFIRLKAVLDFCNDFNLVVVKNKRDVLSRVNPFATYMMYTAPNRFKTANVYRPRISPLNYDEIKEAVQRETRFDEATRATLTFLLSSGLRSSELYKLEKSLDGNWFIKGKGGKIRTVFATPPKNYDLVSRPKVVRALTKLRLTPHHLRKAFATKLAESGLPGHELQTVMGWSSLITAQNYLQQTSTDKIKNKIEKVL